MPPYTQLPASELTRANVLLGLLDLPSAKLSTREFERYLKTMALFFDRLIIPDGWLVCDGPVYQYLRRLQPNDPQDSDPPQLHTSVFHQLLEAGIIVPGLRGERPREAGQPVRGYDFIGTWKGTALKANGRDFGNVGRDSRQMMILERTPRHTALLESIDRAIRFYIPWEKALLPVEAIDPATEEDVKAWDRQFRELTASTVLKGSLSVEETVRENLEVHAVSVRLRPKIRDDAASWFREVGEELRKRCADQGTVFRRATLEDVVGNALIGRPLGHFGELLAKLPGAPQQREREAVPATVQQARAALATTMLSRVSTAQEWMFGKRFGCSVSFHGEYSNDVLLEHPIRLEDRLNLSGVRPSDYVVKGSHEVTRLGLPIDAMDVRVLCELRDREKDRSDGYFARLKAARGPDDLPGLQEELERYLKTIASAAVAGGVAGRMTEGPPVSPEIALVAAAALEVVEALLVPGTLRVGGVLIDLGLLAGVGLAAAGYAMSEFANTRWAKEAGQKAPRAVLDTLTSAFGLHGKRAVEAPRDGSRGGR